jgi:hypothetical protein
VPRLRSAAVVEALGGVLAAWWPQLCRAAGAAAGGDDAAERHVKGRLAPLAAWHWAVSTLVQALSVVAEHAAKAAGDTSSGR